jgi:teichuronic acid biosynthesis glycosyltransferase TuaC
VSVVRLVASKRVDRAIEHVAVARDLDALVVVGDGPERARLDGLARARRVDVRFVGAVSRREALAWIGTADVLLHGSGAEGLSTVVREAESLGTRVVRL